MHVEHIFVAFESPFRVPADPRSAPEIDPDSDPAPFPYNSSHTFMGLCANRVQIHGSENGILYNRFLGVLVVVHLVLIPSNYTGAKRHGTSTRDYASSTSFRKLQTARTNTTRSNIMIILL